VETTVNNLQSTDQSTLDYTPTSVTGSCLVVLISSEDVGDNDPITGINFGDTPMNLEVIGRGVLGDNSNDTAIAYLVNPGISEQTITIAGGERQGIVALTLDNIKQSEAVDVSHGTQETDATTQVTTSQTTSNANSFVLSVCSTGASQNNLSVVGATEIVEFNPPSSKMAVAKSLQSSSGTYSHQWNSSNSDRLSAASVAFNLAEDPDPVTDDETETLYSLNITSAYLQRSETQIPIISAYKELLEKAFNVSSKYLERSVDTFNIASSYKQRDVSSLSLESAYQQREQSTLNIISSYQERLNESLSITTKYNGSNVVIRLDNAQKFIEIAKTAPFSGVITYADGTTATFSRIASIISRFFTPLLASGQQRYTFNTITLDADFEIEVDFATTSTVNFNMLLGKIGSADGFIAIRNGTTISSRFNGVGATLINHNVDGKLTTLNIKRTSGTLVTTIGASTNTITNSNPFEIDILGAYNTNSFSFTGFLANAKITKGSTLVIDAPLDKQYTASNPTVINKADSSNNLTAVNLDNAGQLFTLNADETIWTGEDGTTLEIGE
jgi:hypothetical protein